LAENYIEDHWATIVERLSFLDDARWKWFLTKTLDHVQDMDKGGIRYQVGHALRMDCWPTLNRPNYSANLEKDIAIKRNVNRRIKDTWIWMTTLDVPRKIQMGMEIREWLEKYKTNVANLIARTQLKRGGDCQDAGLSEEMENDRKKKKKKKIIVLD
jgi:hypothetical protein